MRAHDILDNIVPLINDDIVQINRGGCGFFAYWLQHELTVQGIEADIVLVQWAYYTSISVTHMLNKLKVTDINKAYIKMFSANYKGYCDPCFGHLAVKMNNRVYDCNGVLDKQVISEPIDPDVMDMLLYGNFATHWNRTFKDCNEDSVVQDIHAFLNKALKGATA